MSFFYILILFIIIGAIYLYTKNKGFVIINVFTFLFLGLFLYLQNVLEDRYNASFNEGKIITDAFYSYTGLLQIVTIVGAVTVSTFLLSVTWLLFKRK